MGGQQSKCVACCGDKDESGKDVSIQPLDGTGLAGTEEVTETKNVDGLSAVAAAADDKANGKNDVCSRAWGRLGVGGMVDGKREGFGIYKSAIETYEGEWKNDKQHGSGKHSWSDGRSYEGQYVNGRFSGKGKMVWTTDKGIMTYEGDYLDDAKHGFGKFTWPNMNVYEGGWQTGKRHGKATFTTHQGKQKVGYWQEDKFVRWETEENAVAG